MRGGAFFGHLFEALQELEEKNLEPEILFLEASDEVLIRRFKETRRRHPLGDLSLPEAIRRNGSAERTGGKADRVIDTSNLSAGTERKSPITMNRSPKTDAYPDHFFRLQLIAPDADLVFDVRFLLTPIMCSTKFLPVKLPGEGLCLALDGHP